MEIVKIHPPYLFAVRYDGDSLNVYRLTYKNLTDIDYLDSYFSDFAKDISDYLIDSFGYPREEIEEYISEVNDKIIDIEEEIRATCEDLLKGRAIDFGTMFVPHSKFDHRILPQGGGPSSQYGTQYLPVKCWGSEKPSLVRIYAIELSLDCYIIIYGGIKITLSTNDCPAYDRDGNVTTLEKEIRERVDIVSRFLAQEGIIDKEGLIQYMEEEHDS